MKKTIILIAALTLSALGWAILVHTKPKTGTEVIIMKDCTDTTIPKFDTLEVMSLLDIDNHKWESFLLRMQGISNYDYNTVYTTYLPAKNIALANPYERDKEIAVFKQSFISKIEILNQGKNRLAKSSIYVPLLRELNLLALSNARRKIVLISSDLRENTTTFSVYKERDKKLLVTSPHVVRELLEKLLKPTNLNGIDVHLLFKASNDQENEDFKIMSELFKNILEHAGAKVSIGCNLVAGKTLRYGQAKK